MGQQRLIETLQRKARAAARRQRTNAALRQAALWLPLPLCIALGALAYIKLADPPQSLIDKLAVGVSAGLALCAALILRELFRRRAPEAGALALDRYHGLHDRITNALSFSKMPSDQQTGLMRAAIADVEPFVRELKPSRAVPWRLPREALASIALAGLLILMSKLEVQKSQEVALDTTHFTPMTLSADDVELLRGVGDELQKKVDDPEVAAAVRRFNQLVEDIADRRLSREDIFRRLDQLEQQMVNDLELDQEALDEGLDGVARELEKSGLTKPVAEALEQKQLADAEQALRELAERLKDKNTKIDRAKLEQLRKALEQASAQSEERLKKIEAQRQKIEEERRRLLKKKSEGKKLSKNEQQQLGDSERRLERLNRNKKRAERSKKRMSQLDRDLAKAAAELMKELGQGAESLEAGAEDIKRVAQEEMSRKEKQELKRQIEQMRQLLRQQGKGGQQRMQRMKEFGKRARGGKPGPGGKPGQGQGGGQQPGEGKGKPRLTLGQGTRAIEVPVQGNQPGPGAGSGQGQDGQGNQPGGEQWGTGEGGEIKGEKSDLDGKTQDVSAAGVDSGQGTASSEVVYSAAERGFVGRGYQKIYTDYQAVAEDVIASDEIPPGYKFYVRRYFQLIRPRE